MTAADQVAELLAEVDRLTADRDALVLEGFADCEALIGLMLRRWIAMEEGKDGGKGGMHQTRANVLREAELCVHLGQHRTDQYDEAEIRAVHAKAGMPAGMQSAGGKARAASMTATQRSALGRKAIKARWARKEGE